MKTVVIKYKLHNKTYKVRVAYRNSAHIIAGLLVAGAKVTAVGESIVPKG